MRFDRGDVVIWAAWSCRFFFCLARFLFRFFCIGLWLVGVLNARRVHNWTCLLNIRLAEVGRARDLTV